MFIKYTTIKEIKDHLLSLKKENKTIGFVPTMGTLHRGHLSMIERAKCENDFSVVSIFVNPLQFNDKKDFEKYPRTLEQDIEKLKSVHCDILFVPSAEEMYHDLLSHLSEAEHCLSKEEELIEKTLDFGMLNKIMEGKCRPGHFRGVCIVVKKLFDIIEATRAYFGEKDFQQLCIIKHMIKIFQMTVKIVSCPTIRESNGLAMSSRNILLNSDEKQNASYISQTLFEAKRKYKEYSVDVLKKWMTEQINNNPFLMLEYFEVVDTETLTPVLSWTDTENIRAYIAVRIGNVRLIDNIQF